MIHHTSYPYAVLLLLCTLCLFSCDSRRELHEEESVQIRICLDWSSAGLTPDGATIWFFPHTSGRKPKVLRTNDATETITLPRDVYSVLAFNEAETDFNFIRFRGTDRYETFEAYVELVTKNSLHYSMPDILAIDAIDCLDINKTMHPDVRQIVRLNLTPQRVVSAGLLTVNIKGMDNIRLRNNSVAISGMSASLLLASEQNSAQAVAHRFGFTGQKYDSGSYTDGSIEASFVTFGPCADTTIPCIVNLNLALRDGTYFPSIECDVTNQVRTVSVTKAFSTLNIVIGTGSTADDPLIFLPTVPDNEESGSGFDAVVDGWGDEIESDIPI